MVGLGLLVLRVAEVNRLHLQVLQLLHLVQGTLTLQGEGRHLVPQLADLPVLLVHDEGVLRLSAAQVQVQHHRLLLLREGSRCGAVALDAAVVEGDLRGRGADVVDEVGAHELRHLVVLLVAQQDLRGAHLGHFGHLGRGLLVGARDDGAAGSLGVFV